MNVIKNPLQWLTVQQIADMAAKKTSADVIQSAAQKTGVTVNTGQNTGWTNTNTTITAAKPPVVKLPNFDIYGDVSKQATAQQQQDGLGTSSGTKVTDLNSIDISKINLWGYKYGEAAKQQESATPWYLAPRNDVIAAYFFKSGITDPNKIYAELNKNPSFQSANEQDKQNTVNAIAMRIWQQQPVQWEDPIQSEWDNIDKQYESAKNQLLKQGAIEDRYTNFNEVDAEVQNVLQVAWQDRLSKWYNGMPSDMDIQAIAQAAGVDFNRAKRILEGFGYETLNMQDEFKYEMQRWYNRGIEDLETSLARQKQDLQTQMEETKRNIQRQQQDVLRQAERNIEAIQAISALWWSKANTTAFVGGINRIHGDAIRTVERLEVMLQAAQAATDEMGARLMEDYNKELFRAKEDLDYQMRDFNQQMGVELSTRLQQYSGDQLAFKLKELNSEMLNAKIEVVNNYTESLAKINEQKNKEIDAMVKYDNFLKSQNVDQYGKIIKDQGSVLAQMSIPQLIEQHKQWLLTLEQVKLLQQWMVTKWELTLGSNATAADKSKYLDYLEMGATPTEAIKAVIAESWGRLKAPQAFLGEKAKGTGGWGWGGWGNKSSILQQIKDRTITLADARKALGLNKLHATKAQEEIVKMYLNEYADPNNPASIEKALSEVSVVMGEVDNDIDVVAKAFWWITTTKYIIDAYEWSNDDIADSIVIAFKSSWETPDEAGVKQVLKEMWVWSSWNNMKVNNIRKKVKNGFSK